MKKLVNLVIMLVLVLGFCQQAEAKWWIFGQGNDEVNLNYVYINSTSLDETGGKLIMSKDSLVNGFITVKGRAYVKKGKIASVFISTNNKQSWERAKLSDNGTFEYSFAPQLNQEYDLYIQAMDTTRKTNEIEDTYRKIIISNEDSSQLVKEVLKNTVSSYENEEFTRFLSNISSDYTGDSSVLEDKVRKDFNSFDYIKVNYTVNNVSKDGRGRVIASVQFNRTFSGNDGKTYTDNGNTEIIFINDGVNYKIATMKTPMLFGFENKKEEPVEETVAQGRSVSLHSTHIPGRGLCVMGFLFEDEQVSEAPDDNDISLIHRGDGIDQLIFKPSNAVMEVSDWDIAELPESGYSKNSIGGINQGKIYAIQIDNGKAYALVKITGYSSVGMDGEIRFDYKYQSNGTRKF